MSWLAQYSNGSGAGVGLLFLWLLILAGLAFIPASLASNKGYSAVAFYVFGLFFFLPAVIVALVLPAQAGSKISPAPPAPPASPRSGPPAAGSAPAHSEATADHAMQASAATSSQGRQKAIAPPPGPGVVRECPYCKEAMRRDASVCPHCRRESPAWDFRDGRWWTTTDAHEDVWYDETAHRWRAADEPLPAVDPLSPLQDLYDVIVVDPGRNPGAVARIVAEATGGDAANIAALFGHGPTAVVKRVGFATAEGLRMDIARRGGVAELRKLN